METACRHLGRSLGRLSLLGAEVDVITPAHVLDFVAMRATSGQGGIVANHNLHSLYLYQKSAAMRAFYALADLIEIDSTPMIAWARLLGHQVSRDHRCTYLDFREDFWARAQGHDWCIYHIGGASEHNAASRDAILRRYPGVRLHLHTGYFDMNGPDNDALLADIAMHRPQVLLVGMGMPRQEMWILANHDRLPPCVILPVGAAFDYEAGVMYTPPRWTGRIGLEWLVRFVHEPRRLFERYFVEPWHLIPQALKDVASRRIGSAT
ncbi:WecB/TagA/CpsF family glycosyltransferase [Asticcacaulis sp. EMRT-3]|uniref:WecB/TagA/CpsF family glycosyltransferase n=1 Tax=Asticcacaulis sp. EMRT-3 TaxID=3040349 RepID=UPI0024AF4BB5|nr:WecB/TagA/CpsF family glycosyltransferase [Asticcacaulis sp. EMRT-3]MDI7776121.1 WecB/TagA/CpsF family glycosyltransferase [Asticcacaulis sp. EMRT-3]